MSKEPQIQEEEIKTKVAQRVPPGDRWTLVGSKTIHNSITEALEAWFAKTGEKAEFRLAPLDSKLYDVSTEVIVRGDDDVIQGDPTLSPAMIGTFKVQDGEKIVFTADELRTITANRDRVYIIEINLGGVRVHILPSGL
mgnify:CR=1 FL=1